MIQPDMIQVEIVPGTSEGDEIMIQSEGEAL